MPASNTVRDDYEGGIGTFVDELEQVPPKHAPLHQGYEAATLREHLDPSPGFGIFALSMRESSAPIFALATKVRRCAPRRSAHLHGTGSSAAPR